MPTFPKLKTGAVAQYPATRALEFKTECVRFVDGTEQRYRDSEAALRRWEIDLTHLDEAELSAIEQFFATVQGSFARFEFLDPWDGTSYPNCSLDADSLDLTFTGEMNGATQLVVVEGRD
jgi:hypothetical protein